MDNNKMGKREYVDIDGKRYKFNCDVFKKAIERATKSESTNKNRISKDYIISKLADEIMTSSETVRKWQSGNSPSDIDKVKDCAKFLDVDYHMLLISNENKEAHKMTDDERKLIKDVYEGLVDCFYYKAENYPKSDVCGLRVNTEELKKEAYEHRVRVDEFRKEDVDKVKMLHKIIDKASLGVPEVTRNKLHRIVIEAVTPIYCGYFALRWDKIVYDSENDLNNPKSVIINYGIEDIHRYPMMADRDAGLKISNWYYLQDEISLAEKYGFDDSNIKRLSEQFLEDYDGYEHDLKEEPIYFYEEIQSDINEWKDDSGKLPEYIVEKDGKYFNRTMIDDPLKLRCYGFSYDELDEEEGFDPKLIYMDSMVSVLEIVFTHDFPGIEA